MALRSPETSASALSENSALNPDYSSKTVKHFASKVELLQITKEKKVNQLKLI